MKKEYIKPSMGVYAMQPSNIIASSASITDTLPGICNEWCKLWHICRDRQKYKKCYDKQY